MNSNLILNIPHSSDYIPEDCFPKDSEEYRILKEDQINMVDWYTDELFNNGLGIPVIAPVSRMVCDTERFKDESIEPMARIGMGICYETTSDLRHRITITKEHKKKVIREYYEPHHKALELAVDRTVASRGRGFIIDCHSFSPVPLPYEKDQRKDRPDICIGIDCYHTPGQTGEWSGDFFRQRGYKVEINRPYSGTIVPMKYYQKKRVLSLMVEVNRGLYLREGTNEKNDYFPTLKRHLKEFEEYILEKYTNTRILNHGLMRADEEFPDYVYISTVRRFSSKISP